MFIWKSANNSSPVIIIETLSYTPFTDKNYYHECEHSPLNNVHREKKTHNFPKGHVYSEVSSTHCAYWKQWDYG